MKTPTCSNQPAPGDFVSSLARLVHPRHRIAQQDPSSGIISWYVNAERLGVGIFERCYGHPTDIDSVWASREKHQDDLQLQRERARAYKMEGRV